MLIFYPLIEIYLFIKVGSEIGALPTIIFTIFTTFIGLSIIKSQYIKSFTHVRQSFFAIKELEIKFLSNFLLFISGIFFLIPGFFSDLIGLLLLFPFIRIYIIKFFLKKAYSKFQGKYQAKKTKGDYNYIDTDLDN